MAEEKTISVDQLRVGMYIVLEKGWMKHPFMFNKFKLKNQKQIDTIKEAGIQSVGWIPAKSSVVQDEPEEDPVA